MSDRLALTILFVLHVGAVCQFFPPTQVFVSEPLYEVDHPIHAYRVHLYRSSLYESGLPWGYDPAISAGAVSNPGQDLGAKPYQVLGVLLPFLSPGAIGRLFLFLAALTFPLWTLLACRRLGISEDRQVWIMLVLLLIGWMAPKTLNIWHAGLISFTYAAYFAVFVLAVFLEFLERPNGRVYLALCLSAAALFLFHILGPIILLPSLVVLALFARGIEAKWRFALLAVPLVVLAINAFWFVPFLFANHIPQPQGFASTYPHDAVVHQRFMRLSQVIRTLSDPKIGGQLLIASGLTALGLVVLWKAKHKRIVLAFGLACLFGILLWLFGSFVPVAVQTQPLRFKTAAFALMAIPAGMGLAALANRLRLPPVSIAVAIACIFAVYAVATERPKRLALAPSNDPLTEFIVTRTGAGDRLFIQSRDGYRLGDYETKVFPMVFDREIVGSNFPVVWDPPQFLRTMLLGRSLETWEPSELRDALARWGASWVFTYTSEADSLLASTIGMPGEPVGPYLAFHVPGSSSRFLKGSGQVTVTINRIELSQLAAEDGLVVLRYRYHPGWRSVEGIPVLQYAVADDPAGFLAFQDPPESVMLRFDPWRMLRAPWPERAVAADLANVR